MVAALELAAQERRASKDVREHAALLCSWTSSGVLTKGKPPSTSSASCAMPIAGARRWWTIQPAIDLPRWPRPWPSSINHNGNADNAACEYECVRSGLVRYGMVLYGLVRCGAVRYSSARYRTVWYGMVWYGMVWYGMVWYGMVWHVYLPLYWHALSVSWCIVGCNLWDM